MPFIPTRIKQINSKKLKGTQMTINCGMDNIYSHDETQVSIKKKKKIGDESQNHNYWTKEASYRIPRE